MLLAACGSTVHDVPFNIAKLNYKFSTIHVTLADDAKAKASTFKFDKMRLQTAVQEKFKQAGLLDVQAKHTAEIHVTNVFSRTALDTVVFSVFAGEDFIFGDIVIKDQTGRKLNQFRVEAYVSIGGVAGAVTQVRTQWLYDNFATIATQVLTGKK